jgi:hypothetical protein
MKRLKVIALGLPVLAFAVVPPSNLVEFWIEDSVTASVSQGG